MGFAAIAAHTQQITSLYIQHTSQGRKRGSRQVCPHYSTCLSWGGYRAFTSRKHLLPCLYPVHHRRRSIGAAPYGADTRLARDKTLVPLCVVGVVSPLDYRRNPSTTDHSTGSNVPRKSAFHSNMYIASTPLHHVSLLPTFAVLATPHSSPRSAPRSCTRCPWSSQRLFWCAA